MSKKWGIVEDSITSMQKTIKRRQKLAEVFNTEVKEGQVYDTLKGVVIELKDAAKSTISRLIKSYGALYKAMDITDSRKEIILAKKRELESYL